MSTKMEHHKKPWRFELYDPIRLYEWEPLNEIDEDEIVEAEKLRNELNRINAPLLLRIVPNDD
jgi:hypothetical protein